MKKTTNPNGANQYVLDPRQKMCWELYTTPKSETFGNATQSGIKAGYTEDYSDQITMTDWFKGKLWKLNAVMEGEDKLRELMELPIVDVEGKVDVGIARIQADLAKYVTSTLGKDEGYSSRSEVTGKDGKDLVDTDTRNLANLALDKYLNGSTTDTN